mgnify:CR=1 FL=1
MVNLVDPIPIKKMRVAAPSVQRFLTWVIVGVVVIRYIDWSAFRNIAIIFLFQATTVIFKVVEDIQRPVVGIFDQAGAHFGAAQQSFQAGMLINLVLTHFGPARHRDHKVVGKTAQVGRGRSPVLLTEAVAPHIAAQREGRRITAERLVGFCRGAMMQPLDLMLIEGAGGWRVPLNQTEHLSELPRRLKLPTILVVGMRLGCINHALLSVEAIAADGVPLAGWVANCIDADMACYQENLDTLKARIRAPLLAELPFIDEVSPLEAAKFMEPGIKYLLDGTPLSKK